jgi:hypothetical protein
VRDDSKPLHARSTVKAQEGVDFTVVVVVVVDAVEVVRVAPVLTEREQLSF